MKYSINFLTGNIYKSSALISLVILFFTNNSIAGEIYDASVTGIAIDSGVVMVKIGENTIKTAQPSCATGIYAWSFSTGSNVANMFLSTLIAAKTSGQKVRIIGSSSCTVDGNKEDISRIILVDGPT